MKRTNISICLVLIFAIGVFAGDYPNGGKTCQPTPTTPCQNLVSQGQELPVLSLKDYLILLVKNIRLF